MLENITNTNNRKRNKAKDPFTNLPKQISNPVQVSSKVKEEFKSELSKTNGRNNDTVIIQAVNHDSIKQRNDSQISFKENSPTKNNISIVSKANGNSLFMNQEHNQYSTVSNGKKYMNN